MEAKKVEPKKVEAKKVEAKKKWKQKKVEAKRGGAIFVSSSGKGGRQRNLLCAKRNLRRVLCAGKERYNWLSLIMNAEIPLWVLGSAGSPPSKRLSVLQIMFLGVVRLWSCARRFCWAARRIVAVCSFPVCKRGFDANQPTGKAKQR